MVKGLRRLVLVPVSVMAFATAIPAPAQGDAAPGTRSGDVSATAGTRLAANRIVTLQNRFTRACLDDSFEFGLRGFPCNGLAFQHWNTVLEAEAMWNVSNMATGRCLDDSFEYGLRAIVCNGYPHQLWTLQDRGGALELWNRQTHRCLDDSPLGVRTFQCNGQDYQRWDYW